MKKSQFSRKEAELQRSQFDHQKADIRSNKFETQRLQPQAPQFKVVQKQEEEKKVNKRTFNFDLSQAPKADLVNLEFEAPQGEAPGLNFRSFEFSEAP